MLVCKNLCVTWICLLPQVKDFGWKVYKATRNRTDSIIRWYPQVFKSFFFHRDASGNLAASAAACQLLGSWGITEGKHSTCTCVFIAAKTHMHKL
jgi:hypothetical protein